MKISIVVLVAFLSLPALAHHNYRLRYDYDHMVTVTGVLTKFDWKNPHVEFFMDVEAENGNVTKWIMPTGSPNVLTRNGMTPDTFLPGVTLVVTGAIARNGSNEMRARTITLEDGTSFGLSPNNGGQQGGMGAGGTGQGGMGMGN